MEVYQDAPPGLNDIRSYIRSFKVIGLGATFRDRIVLLTNRLYVLAYPFNRLLMSRSMRPLTGQPTRQYRCITGGLIFTCSGGRCEEQLLSSFEPEVWRALRNSPPGDFIDVGANIGVYAVRMARRIGASRNVVAIEPHPLYQELLKQTIAENRLENIKIVGAAAWSAPGSLTLYEHALGGSRMDNSVVYKVSKRGLPVRATTLDAVVETYALDKLAVVKIDAEGAEARILEGMVATLETFRKLRIIFEVLSATNLVSCRQTLSRYGFSVRPLAEGTYLSLGPDADN
jgi:FkbM family methyltransferase